MTSKSPSVRPTTDRLRRAWRGTPLPGFLAWWGGELRASLPPRWRDRLQGGAQWLLLTPLDDHAVQMRRDGQREPCGHIDDSLAPQLQQVALRDAAADIDRADLRLALCLPASAVLRKCLTLPAAARANLHQVMAYEMDRQTPFRVAEVYYDVRAVATSADARMTVELLATPRARVDPLLQRLAGANVHVDALDVGTGDGRMGINMLPPAQRPQHPNPQRRLNLALAGGLLVLLLLAMGQWLHNRRQVLAQMQTQVDSLHTQARAVMGLRRQLGENVGAAGFLSQRKSQAPAMLDLLDAVTRRLPDATWLQRLSVDNDQLGMQGQSPQATQLLKRMKGSPLYGEPSFQGVITADPKTNMERFYMVAPMSAPASATTAATSPTVTEAADARTQAR